MPNVACVKVGTKYSAEYVNVLFDCVRRNLAPGIPGEFICFTDDATGLDPLITVRPVPKELASRGWWAKLYLFSKEAFPEGGQVLYFDLDTVVCGPIDAIAQYKGEFAILKDAYRPGGWQSSVMSWNAGSVGNSAIWESWNAAGRPEIPGGDQAWIEECVEKPDLWQDVFPNKFASYKVEARAAIPKGCSVVFFHGEPMPHQVTTGWVPAVWKVGGGSGVEWVVTANVSKDELRRNAAYAVSLDCDWLDIEPEREGSVCIVGGGPSLKDTLFYVRGMKMSGSEVWATNNAYRYLVTHGIQPDRHIMLDARAENLAFVPEDDCPKFYASQCHPSVLDKAGQSLTSWHCAFSGYESAYADHYSAEVQVGGGTTVGLKALAMAYIAGFRNMRLFGFDSSYGESHHAYPQKINDGERTVTAEVAGRKFLAAPWMVAQAEEFKETVSALVSMGCMVTVYGDGLLPAVAEELGKKIRMVDGLYWPAADIETRSSVLATSGDIDTILGFVKGRGIAVQAGGNVGVWPKTLSKHFGKVVTFEPDPINWECFSKNVTEDNVEAYNCALGDKPGKVGVRHDTFNCGASQIVAEGDIDVMTVDSLGLPRCDLLQLDIEGYEFNALKGAAETIERCSPVIVLEQKGLGSAYGSTDEEVAEWLKERGYSRTHAIHRDVIYTRNV